MSGEQVLPELVEEHFVSCLVAAIVMRVLLLNAVIGQVAGHVLEVGAVVGLRGSPQHTFSVKVDVVLMVYEHPAPNNIKCNVSETLLSCSISFIKINNKNTLPDVKLAMARLKK